MKHVEWTEDVRLSSGQTIVVQRSEDYRRVVDSGAGFQEGWLFQSSRITAELPPPVGRKVSWQGSLIPLVLDIQQGDAIFLVGYVATGAGQDEWGTPRTEFYVPFRLVGDSWQRIPLAGLPLAVQPNLLGASYILFIERNARSGIHVDQRLKAEIASTPTLVPQIKSILRIPKPAAK